MMRNRLHRVNQLSACLAAVLFSAFAANAQSGAPNVRLAIRTGMVEVQRGSSWFPISMGDSINAGEKVRTEAGSMAALEIGSGKVVTLNEQSEIQINQSAKAGASPMVQLVAGSMKVFSTGDIQVAAKDTIIETAEQPLDMELGYQSDTLNLMVFSGAVRSGPMVIRAGNQDPNVRTYTANGRSQRNRDSAVPDSNFYIYPYFWYGNADPNAGRIVPPVVNNPTNPGYRPTQIVPPMSDPIHVPVTTR